MSGRVGIVGTGIIGVDEAWRISDRRGGVENIGVRYVADNYA
jgi:hypothetical protein